MSEGAHGLKLICTTIKVSKEMSRNPSNTCSNAYHTPDLQNLAFKLLHTMPASIFHSKKNPKLKFKLPSVSIIKITSTFKNTSTKWNSSVNHKKLPNEKWEKRHKFTIKFEQNIF